MVSAKQLLLTVTLAWLLTLAKTSRQLSSIETEETTAFCCARGYAYFIETDSCLEDEFTSKALDFEGQIRKDRPPLHLYASCESGNLGSDQLIIDLYHDSQNGSIYYIINYGKHNAEDYCLYRKLNTTIYWTLKCWPAPKNTLGLYIWISACAGVTTIVALITVIVYIVILELNNSQGRIVCSFFISYLCCMILLTSAALTTLIGCGRKIPDPLQIIYASTLLYFGAACLLWLNVMSFEIWKTIRHSGSNEEVEEDEPQRITFICYSMYAWCTPFIPFLILCIILALHLRFGFLIELLLLSLPILGIFVCNTYFYITTNLKIKQRDKEIAKTDDDVDERHQNNEQWFYLYLKLFIIMGCPIILFVLPFVWPEEKYVLPFIASVEPIKAICVFYVFVLKDDVRRAIRKQLAKMMYRLGFSCPPQHDIEPDI